MDGGLEQTPHTGLSPGALHLPQAEAQGTGPAPEVSLRSSGLSRATPPRLGDVILSAVVPQKRSHFTSIQKRVRFISHLFTPRESQQIPESQRQTSPREASP